MDIRQQIANTEERPVIVIFFHPYSFLGAGYRWFPGDLISAIHLGCLILTCLFCQPKLQPPSPSMGILGHDLGEKKKIKHDTVSIYPVITNPNVYICQTAIHIRKCC